MREVQVFGKFPKGVDLRLAESIEDCKSCKHFDICKSFCKVFEDDVKDTYKFSCGAFDGR